MLLVKISIKGDGLHPRERVVSVETKGGEKILAVDRASLHEENLLEVSWPVERKDAYLLVELPQEAFDGSWRVWVRESDTRQFRKAAVA